MLQFILYDIFRFIKKFKFYKIKLKIEYFKFVQSCNNSIISHCKNTLDQLKSNSKPKMLIL